MQPPHIDNCRRTTVLWIVETAVQFHSLEIPKKNRAKKSPLQLCKLTRFSCWASTGILFWHSVTTGKQNERKASKNQIQDYRTGYQFYLVLDILRSSLVLTFNYERLWSAVCSKSLISHLIKSKNYVKRVSTACQESSVQ